MSVVDQFLKDAVITWTSNTLTEDDKKAIMRLLPSVRRDHSSKFSLAQKLLVAALEFLHNRDAVRKLGISSDLVTRVNDRDIYDAVFEQIVLIGDLWSPPLPLQAALPPVPAVPALPAPVPVRTLPPFISIPERQIIPFTSEHMTLLVEGVHKYGTRWEAIRASNPQLRVFSGTQLQDKYALCVARRQLN